MSRNSDDFFADFRPSISKEAGHKKFAKNPTASLDALTTPTPLIEAEYPKDPAVPKIQFTTRTIFSTAG